MSLHAGTEYQHAANSYQISLAKRLLASPDVDLILGAHAHVVQPLERIGDKWIAYGMGNQVAWQNQAYNTRDGIMPRFTFAEVSPGAFRVVKAEVIPTFMWLDGAPARLHDVSAVLAAAGRAGSAACLVPRLAAAHADRDRPARRLRSRAGMLGAPRRSRRRPAMASSRSDGVSVGAIPRG